MTPAYAKLILYEALAEPIGLLLRCENLEACRAKLYQAKRAALDPQLDVLQLRAVLGEEGNLAIVKGARKE